MDTIDMNPSFWKDDVKKATYWENFLAEFGKEF